MNYRHGFHAGNHADILKHIILCRVIVRLAGKGKPFSILDAHAGSAVYDLMGAQAGKTQEWQEGIAKMSAPFAPDVERLLQPFRNVLRALNGFGPVLLYPGSPEFARLMLGSSDTLLLNELQDGERAALQARYGTTKGIKISGQDARVAVKSRLPFPERRGIVLLDPPYEKPDDTREMAVCLREGLRRMANAIFLVWYPEKGELFGSGFVDEIAAATSAPMLQATLHIREAFDNGGLTGSGVLVVNPPWQLEEDLAVLLPALAERLGIGRWGRGTVRFITPPL